MAGFGAEGINPLRPPRVIGSDRIIRPYIFEDAMGNKILKVSAKVEATSMPGKGMGRRPPQYYKFCINTDQFTGY